MTMTRSAKTSPGSGPARGIRRAAPIHSSPRCKPAPGPARRLLDRARLAALRSHERVLEKRLSAPGGMDAILCLRRSLRDDAQRRAAANRRRIAQAIDGVATRPPSEVSRSSSPFDQTVSPTNGRGSSPRRCSPGTDPCHSPTTQHPTDKCKSRALHEKERSSSAVSSPSPDLIRVALIVDRASKVAVFNRFGDLLLSIEGESADPQGISPPVSPGAPSGFCVSAFPDFCVSQPRRAKHERRRAPRR